MSSVRLLCCDVKLKTCCAVIGWIGVIITMCLGLQLTFAIDEVKQADGCSLFVTLLQLLLLNVGLQLFASVCLIITTETKNRFWLLPWLIVTVINVISLIGIAFTSNWGLYFSFVMLPILIFTLPIVLLYLEELDDCTTRTVAYISTASL